MNQIKCKVVISFLALIFTFNIAHADLDFDISDLFSLNTAFDEHHHSAISGLFNLHTAFDEHRYSALSDLFNLNTAFQPDDRIVINWNENWNMISLNVVPPEEFWENEEGPDVILMMEHLRIDEEHHHVLILKDQDGRFYSPAFNFNNIPYWNFANGYHVKMDSEGLRSTFYGTPISADEDILLDNGWNIAAYFPTYELDASAPHFYVLSSILDDLIIAKNSSGEFIAPAYDFSNMPPWRESQGYLIKVNEDVILNYPQQQDEQLLASIDSPLSTSSSQQHWRNPVRTGNNMSFLVYLDYGKAADGDQIAVFNTQGKVVGCGIVADNRCGIAVWGDDDHTETIDGLREGEAFTLKLWNADQHIEQPLLVESFLQGSSLTYAVNDVLAISAMIETCLIPDDYFLANAYPNPFNSVIRLNYGLPETARLSIKVYDISGRLVSTLVDTDQPAGYHSTLWNGNTTSSGTYLVNMESNNFSTVRKITLVK